MTLINRDEAISLLLSKMFSLIKDSPKGKGVMYSLLQETESFFSFIASIMDTNDHSQNPIDRSRVVVERVSGKVQTPTPISLSREELADAIWHGTGHHISSFARFNDGALSISYKVSVLEDPDVEYVVQLRHHGDVASMNSIMLLVSTLIPPHILPVPAVYPIADERELQCKHGMGIQITRFVPGVMANSVYPTMTHEDRLLLVRKLALAFDALWRIPIPSERLIGELNATREGDTIRLHVSADRHFSLGGPFCSVADYLRAKIRGSLDSFRRQQCIEEYKSRYLQPVTDFVSTGMLEIPAVVEQIPVVPVHSDMGLHNIIVSATNPADIMAIIDWEFCSSAPYATAHSLIERLFREWSPNEFGEEYPHADELRRAFWETIPEWKRWNESEATTVFVEWFRFASFMRAEPMPDNLEEEEKNAWWTENVRVTEAFLGKYHPQWAMTGSRS